jgi:hypothetical protein
VPEDWEGNAMPLPDLMPNTSERRPTLGIIGSKYHIRLGLHSLSWRLTKRPDTVGHPQSADDGDSHMPLLQAQKY